MPPVRSGVPVPSLSSGAEECLRKHRASKRHFRDGHPVTRRNQSEVHRMRSQRSQSLLVARAWGQGHRVRHFGTSTCLVLFTCGQRNVRPVDRHHCRLRQAPISVSTSHAQKGRQHLASQPYGGRAVTHIFTSCSSVRRGHARAHSSGLRGIPRGLQTCSPQPGPRPHLGLAGAHAGRKQSSSTVQIHSKTVLPARQVQTCSRSTRQRLIATVAWGTQSVPALQAGIAGHPVEDLHVLPAWCW